MVIDTHQHYWQFGRFSGPRFDQGSVLNRDFFPRHVKPAMDGCGVQRVIAVHADSSVDETRWLLQLANESAYIAGVVGWVDLARSDVGQTLEQLVGEPRLRGLRHPVENEPDPDWLVREDVLRGLQEVSQSGLPFDLLVRPQHLKHVITLIERIPKLRMVVDHLAKPSILSGTRDVWTRDLAEIAQAPQVYCKLSGMITEAQGKKWQPADFKPFVDTVVDLFGYDRVMFGSDWPVCSTAGSYMDVYQVLVQSLRPMPPELFAKVFGDNASQFYRLGMMEYFVTP